MESSLEAQALSRLVLTRSRGLEGGREKISGRSSSVRRYSRPMSSSLSSETTAVQQVRNSVQRKSVRVAGAGLGKGEAPTAALSSAALALAKSSALARTTGDEGCTAVNLKIISSSGNTTLTKNSSRNNQREKTIAVEASLAAKNLRATLRAVDALASAPARAREVSNALKKKNWMEAFLRALALDRWRKSLQDAGGCDEGVLDAMLGEHVQAAVDAREKLTNAIYEAVDGLVFEACAGTEKLSREKQVDFVQAASAIEAARLLQKKKKKGTTSDNNANLMSSDDDDEEDEEDDESYFLISRKKALERLRSACRGSLASAFARAHIEAADSEVDLPATVAAEAMALAAKRLAATLEAAAPPSWKSRALVATAAQAHARGQVVGRGEHDDEEDFVQGVGEVAAKAKALRRLDIALGTDAFANEVSKLATAYVSNVAQQLTKWFAETRHKYYGSATAGGVRATRQGHLITSRPEDLFHIVETQVAVAKDQVDFDTDDATGRHVAAVALRCLEELRADAQELKESTTRGETSIDHDGKKQDTEDEETSSLETCVALANDCLRCAMRVRQAFGLAKKHKKVSKLLALLDESAQKAVSHVAKAVAADYEEAAFAAAAKSAVFPVKDVRSCGDLFSPGSRAWQRNDPDAPDAVETALRTVEDYVVDLDSWLAAPALRKTFAFVALEHLVRLYVDAFLRSGPDTQFDDADIVAAFVLRDQNSILHFFLPRIQPSKEEEEEEEVFSEDADDDLEDYTQLRTQPEQYQMQNVAEVLKVLRDIAELAAATPPDLPHYAIHALLPHFHKDTTAVVLAVVQRHPVFASTRLSATLAKRNLLIKCRDLVRAALANANDADDLLSQPNWRFTPLDKSSFNVLAFLDDHQHINNIHSTVHSTVGGAFGHVQGKVGGAIGNVHSTVKGALHSSTSTTNIHREASIGSDD